MYEPYNPYAQYQSYNDPQPDHYASGVPPGMPQPARPSAFASAEPAYASYYGNTTNSPAYGSQPYGSQQPSYYPATPAPTEDQYTPSYGSLSHSASNQYPPLAPQPSPSVSHSGSHHYPPPFGQSTAHQYPPAAPPDPYSAVSSGGYSTSHSDVSADNSWAAANYPPRKEHSQQEERLQSHAIPKRDDKKEKISFSVDEAQAIIKQLKETIKSLNLQLTNSRDSTNKVVQEKDAKLEQLQREIEAVRREHAQAVDPREAVAAVEREWTQRVAFKEQEILARTQRDADAMAETLSKSQQENAALLARVSKLQSDAESGRASLLETNSALEAELVTRKAVAGQQDAEVLRLKVETEKQEAELMELREETNKLYDESTQMVDEKEQSRLSLQQLENEKRELEAQLTKLKDHSEGYMAEKKAVGAEKSTLLERVAALEQELEECRDLCENRRQRIESLENEELPTLNSQLDWMATLDEKARRQIAELKEKLEDGRKDVAALETQLNEAQKQEMENSLRVAGESRSAKEELQRLRFELDNHVQGKLENQKSVSELELQKVTFEKRAAQVEAEKNEAVEQISALEKSLEDITAAKEHLEMEFGFIRDTLDRETEENLQTQNAFRLQIKKLEEQVSTLTTAKSTLEARVADSEANVAKSEAEVADSEAKVLETKRILQATEDMLKALEEEMEQKRETTTTAAKGAAAPSEEKAMLEETLAKLEEKNAQIAKLTEKAQALEEEKEGLCNKMDSMAKDIDELESLVAEKGDALEDTRAELLAKKRLEREVKGLRFELSKENTEMERLKAEVEELAKLSRDASGKIFELEVDRGHLEEKTAALLEEKKRDFAKASQLGEDILKLETENKELDTRVSDMTSKYCDIVAERDELVQTNRNLLRNK